MIDPDEDSEDGTWTPTPEGIPVFTPRNPVLDEITTRERVRGHLAEVARLDPYGPLGVRITERLLRSAGY